MARVPGFRAGPRSDSVFDSCVHGAFEIAQVRQVRVIKRRRYVFEKTAAALDVAWMIMVALYHGFRLRSSDDVQERKYHNIPSASVPGVLAILKVGAAEAMAETLASSTTISHTFPINGLRQGFDLSPVIGHGFSAQISSGRKGRVVHLEGSKLRVRGASLFMLARCGTTAQIGAIWLRA